MHLLSKYDTTPITIETSLPFTGHNLDPPSRSVETTPNELFTFFHDMALMRLMEIAADSLYKAKLIRGFWPRGRRRRYGGRYHENGLHNHRISRPLHLPRARWDAPGNICRAHVGAQVPLGCGIGFCSEI
ncbi:Pyruvate dehydrogenase E1 component subunit alpha-2, mitochondrial [Castilleja foliolosa]|uniref:Pyruvate dehydrogenase E1 component subunit alpha-2, mitochondrial n=1 Tax=Castilleja foliolosa TaxID=1961234 RepID=A0ABD3DQM4_9LAMI